MIYENFGFYFEASGRGATQGAIAPAEQFFEGSHAEESLVREIGQNSLDARSGADPVTMVFELASMRTDDIPGIEGLRQHIVQSATAAEGSQGHDRMVRAAETAQRDEVMVLRISDFGTNGLGGSESINDPQSPLTALTRGAGVSADDGARGGSFGIGSAVGPMSSDMCTVLYTSLPRGGSGIVFAGYSRLATHRDTENTWRFGDGFFTDLTNVEDFRYLRNPQPVGQFDQRDEAGTDLYILGYRKAMEDPELAGVRLAFLNNFLPAIHRGHLIVIGRVGESEWVLNAETLSEYVSESVEATAFYRALLDPSPIEVDTKRFGKIKLYINVDDSLERSLYTMTMRTPLMKIDTFKHRSIPIKYAAILECADDKGNKFLRELEPPQHHRWDPARHAEGKSALQELKEFVRQQLRARVKDQVGDQVEIKGLAKFLPAPSLESVESADADGGTPSLGEGSLRESATVQGEQGVDEHVSVNGKSSISLGVRTPANAGGDRPASQGRTAGGAKSRKSKGGSLPGKGKSGKEGSRIEVQDLRFRSWTDAATGEICLALTPTSDVHGDLELVPLGPGGVAEESYVLPLSDANMTVSGEKVPVQHAGNVIKALDLTADSTTVIRLTLSTRHRYRLGVK